MLRSVDIKDTLCVCRAMAQGGNEFIVKNGKILGKTKELDVVAFWRR